MKKMAILIPTHNRKEIIERAIPSIIAARDRAIENGVIELADVYIYDDGSTEYDEEFLFGLSDGAFVESFAHFDSENSRRSVAMIRELMFVDALEAPTRYDHFLHVDSDMFFDIEAFAQLEALTNDCPQWGVISLYNPSRKDWEAKGKMCAWAAGSSWFQYGLAGGCLMTRRPLPSEMHLVSVSPTASWDGWYTIHFGGGFACISRESFCEHLGAGIHDGKPARNPSKWLVQQELFV